MIKIYQNQRVVTFKDIDTVHERPDGTARKRFADNKERFTLGKHYFVLHPGDVKSINYPEKINNRGTTLITESGYLLLVKSFTDDLAWKVQGNLVDMYFHNRIRERADQP